MRIKAFDHVNVITDHMDETAGFYTAVLGLKRRDAPPPLLVHEVQWMVDDAGRALIHIAHADRLRAMGREVTLGQRTGAINHIAFSCKGFAALIARLEVQGVEHRVNTIESIGLKQVFVTDPNLVVIELNFYGD